MASRFAGQNAASDFKTAEYCRPSGYRNRRALGVHTRDAGTGCHLGQNNSLDARARKRKSRHRWRRHRAIERFTMKQILRSASVCNGSIVYSLHRGRSQRVIVRVVPDYQTALYRIAWPDIGFSDTANLTRCKDAAREWAERNIVIEDRKSSAARRLKSLDNLWWSWSYIAQNVRGAA
jgi:hypothetical protein